MRHHPIVVTAAHLKGGAGKTTLSLALAGTWHRQGMRVLVLDLDDQGTSTSWDQVGRAMDQDIPQVEPVDGRRLGRVVAKRAHQYDAIVIDTPPRLAKETKAAMLTVGDHNGIVLVPLTPGAGDKWALTKTMKVFKEAKKLRPSLQIRGVSVRGKNTDACKSLLADAAQSVTMLDAPLSDRTAFVEAQMLGAGVVQHAPRSRAAEESRALCREVIQFLNGDPQ